MIPFMRNRAQSRGMYITLINHSLLSLHCILDACLELYQYQHASNCILEYIDANKEEYIQL